MLYTIHDYGDMIADHGRIDAYARALRQVVTPDSVVLDIGAGPGIMTLLACQAGARKVYAVEPDAIIEVARETVAANGYADRVELFQALSTAIDLPEQVDVIVADVHGVMPLFMGSARSILDARDRFLRPNGVVIPREETIWVAVTSSPAALARVVEPWNGRFGHDEGTARRRAVNTWSKWRCPADAILADPVAWTSLDYLRMDGANARGRAVWTIGQAAPAHGLTLWFDCETAPGCGFSNSPLSREHHVFDQAFFPWPEACALEPGDRVAVDIRADLVGADYIWGWDTEVCGSHGRPKAQFRQSQFMSASMSADWLRKSGAAFVPSPNREASIDKMVLDLFSSGITLEEIARRLAGRFPDRFPDWRKALTRVGELSLRYSE